MSEAPAGTASSGRPLSPVERRLWLLDQLLPGRTGYDSTFVVKLVGTVGPAALLAALRLLAQRHPALAACVELDGEVPVSRPSNFPVGLELDDLRSDAAPKKSAGPIVAADTARPLDTATGPLLRARLVRLGDEESWLVLRLHALAVDPDSSPILLADLATAYVSVLAGTEPGWPPPAPHSDRATAAPPVDVDPVDRERRERLAAATALELPTDRSSAAVPESPAGRLVRALDRATTQRLTAVAKATGVTPAEVCLAALAAVLGRYSGAPAAMLGIPVAGRPVDAAGVVGRFEEYAPLLVDLAGDPSLATLARQVATAVAAEAGSTPLVVLAQRSAAGWEAEDPPIRAAFRADRRLRPPLLPGIAVTVELPAEAELPVELLLVLHQGPAVATLEWRFATRHFTPAAVARMAGHFEQLLGAALAEPDAPVSAAELLSADEQAQLTSWGRGPAPAYGPDAIPEWFAATAAEHAGAEAVRGPDGALTYTELDAASNRLAHSLRALGAGRGALVAVCLDRCTALLVALLGVVKSGAAYVPLDPTYPADRIEVLLRDAGCSALVTTGDLLARLPRTAARTVLLDADARQLAASPAGPVEGGPSRDDPAYVIYTSGSTGSPKGVVVGHAGLCNLLRAMAAEPGLGPGETMVGVTTPAFDLSVPDLFLPLVTGARLVLAGPEDTVDGTALGRLLDRAEADLLQATPATWRLLLDSGWTGRPGLRAVVGGEAVPAALAALLAQRTAGVWNFYGPTEATVWTTAAHLGGPDGAEPADPLTIGRPLPGVYVAVVDRADRLAPIGVVGELLIAGAGVARGYLDSPELTSTRFVELPVTGGRRAYRSGDLARWRPDGQLEFACRVDAQVKLRGFRVEPGEVEAALRAQPGVRDAVVLLREDAPGDQRLVGYVVGAPALDPAELRTALARALPAYMVPAAYVVLPALPRTANGKLDRTALSPPDAGNTAAGRYLAPRTPVEQTVATLWAQVLGIERVGVHDDFFDLGGHSLLVLQVAARLPRLLPVDLPVRRLFELRTVESLALAITQALAASSVDGELTDLLAGLEAAGDLAS